MVKLCCPNLLSFGHTPRPPAFRRRPDRPAHPIWCRVQTGAACQAFGRVCRCVVSCAVCLASGMVCLAACAVQAVRVRWGLGSLPAGYIAAAQPRPVSLSTTEKIKKAQKTPHPPLPISKIFRKNKKTPTKGLCSVLYLPYKP